MARESMVYLSVMIPAHLREDLDTEVSARSSEPGGMTLAMVVRERLAGRSWAKRAARRARAAAGPDAADC